MIMLSNGNHRSLIQCRLLLGHTPTVTFNLHSSRVGEAARLQTRKLKLTKNSAGTGSYIIKEQSYDQKNKASKVQSKSYSKLPHCERETKMHLFKRVACLERILKAKLVCMISRPGSATLISYMSLEKTQCIHRPQSFSSVNEEAMHFIQSFAYSAGT